MRLLYKICDMDAIAPADFDGFMTGFRQHAMEFYIFASRLMWHLKYGDKHAVEVTPAKPPKANPVNATDRGPVHWTSLAGSNACNAEAGDRNPCVTQTSPSAGSLEDTEPSTVQAPPQVPAEDLREA